MYEIHFEIQLNLSPSLQQNSRSKSQVSQETKGTSLSSSVVGGEVRLWFEAALRGPVALFLPVTLFIIIVIILAVRVLIEADGGLDGEVPQESLTIAVQVVKGFGLRPEQPAEGNNKLMLKIRYFLGTLFLLISFSFFRIKHIF